MDTSLVGSGDAGLISLDAPAAADPRWGGKASNLALARQAGLDVVDGFVLSPSLAATLAGDRRVEQPADEALTGADSAAVEATRTAWVG